MAKAKEKKALQIIENEARKANQDEFNIRLTIAKINALVPYSKKTLEECLINSGSSGSQNTLSDYNAALIYATDACINDGMTRSDFDSVISKAVNDQKLFENLTTENQINNTGGGASAVPVVSVGGASK